MTRWRQRLGEEQLVALIQESLSVAHKTGALANKDLERVVVDTTVQPKAIAHPTDARLCIGRLRSWSLLPSATMCLAAELRRVAKRAAIMAGRYSHAHQFKRARRRSSSCAPGSAGSSATSAARSPAMRHWRPASPPCSIWRRRCATRTIVNAGRRSIRCTRLRSSASARARRGAL